MLADKFRYLKGGRVSKKILIIGSGRSGTHWIGHILQAHPEIRATIEGRPAFGWVTRMALDPRSRSKLYSRLVNYYRIQHLLSVPQHYLDKSHPNIWLAEELAETFDDVVFVGIRRSPYATVASMLLHDGVLGWHQKWREFPVPNAFLGIGVAEQETYETLSLPAKCAMRWKAHQVQLDRLRGTLQNRIMVVQYEDLFTSAPEILENLRSFIGLTSAIPAPVPRTRSANKWREQLSAFEISEIEKVVGISPEEIAAC